MAMQYDICGCLAVSNQCAFAMNDIKTSGMCKFQGTYFEETCMRIPTRRTCTLLILHFESL